MKIYTSYYGNLKKLHNAQIIPIGVSLYRPKWFKGMSLGMLAPRREMLSDDMSTEEYIVKYNKILEALNFNEIVRMIKGNGNGSDVALLCYEKPGDFCHRHLLADWLNKKGDLQVEEFMQNQEPVKIKEVPKESSQITLF